MELIAVCEGFAWDEANVLRNWESHGVTASECEQVFFNIPLLVHDSLAHGGDEERFLVLGRSDANRKPFLVITIRGKRIRIISARDMTPKERGIYESKK